MRILNRLKERNERKSREREINRYAEETRLETLEKKEKSELEQERRLSEKRSNITKMREEKRKLNPSVVDKLFRPVSSRPKKREKAYPSIYGSSKKQASSNFSTVSSPQFAGGFTDVLGTSIYGRSPGHQRNKHHKSIYVKKGKKFIKVKGKHKHSNRPKQSNYDPIWGHGMGL